VVCAREHKHRWPGERAGAARDLHSFGVAVGDCCATVQRRSTGDAI